MIMTVGEVRVPREMLRRGLFFRYRYAPLRLGSGTNG